MFGDPPYGGEMRLTSNDETELLLPLYAGVHDRSQWVNFLVRIQRRTQADYASLIFSQGDTPIHLSTEVFVGRDLRKEARERGLESLYDKDRLPYDGLRPGRVYQMSELVAGDPEFTEFHETFNRAMGLSDERIVRIKEQEGTSAWLMLARNRGLFGASHGALLTALAPHVAVALRSFVLAERQRIRGAANRDGLSRMGMGWIALGRDARIIDLDPNLIDLLREINGSGELIGARLHIEDSAARQTLVQAARDFAGDADAVPRTLNLRDEPRLDALMVPTPDRPEAALAMPVMLVFCRFGRSSGLDRRPLLRDVFGLSLREGQLAFALSNGQSLSEAAAAMGLTEETVRGYSKNIYAKMGIRGQADLVRQIFLSSISLA